jgi:H+/Cl- antiporter ClcA
LLHRYFLLRLGAVQDPKRPLVQILGSFGGWLGSKLGLTLLNTRVLTFCGMSAALGAFFGAPLGGALFALEIPHRRGLEYYEALIPAVLSAILSFFVFRFNTGLTIGGMYQFAAIPALTLMSLGHGLLLGAAGALIAVIFVGLFRLIGLMLKRWNTTPFSWQPWAGWRSACWLWQCPKPSFLVRKKFKRSLKQVQHWD